MATPSVFAVIFPMLPWQVIKLTYTYPNKPLRKIKVTICSDQANNPLHVWPNVWSGDLENVAIHDTECP